MLKCAIIYIMIVKSEKEMLEFGESFAKKLDFPAVIELIGDVGAGKTTFTRGLAKGLGILEPVTSPSFMISKKYTFPSGILTHYDFYRLDEPGIMVEDLAEAMNEKSSVVVVEWGESAKDVLPEDRIKISIKYLEDGTREISL